MRRTLLLVLCLALASSAFALGNADISILSFTADKSSVEAGGTVTLTVHLKNLGTERALLANFNLGNSYFTRMHVLHSSAPAGWTCSPLFTSCFAEQFEAGAEATLTMTIVVPSTIRDPQLVISFFGSAFNESTTENNRADVALLLTPPSRTSDLGITVSGPPNPVKENTPVTLTYDVRNNGPDDLSDIHVDLFVPLVAQPEVSGNGWTCERFAPYATSCRRDSIAAGTSAPLSAQLSAPGTQGEVSVFASAWTSQPHSDPTANDEAWHTIFVGDASSWSRVLVPITATDFSGANGSLWHTETKLVLESDTPFALVPSGCGAIEDPCATPPFNQLIDARDEDLIDPYSESFAQFIYVERAAASKVKMSTRVYDVNKADQTAGAFIPTARDEDFKTGGFSLVAVPVAPQFRSTLRIYEYDGKDDSVVEIALYGDDEAQPFDVRTEHLTSDSTVVTSALLPYHPGYAQIDLSSRIPQRYARVSVRVRPVDPSLKLWGFASITNNQTSHVTVVAP